MRIVAEHGVHHLTIEATAAAAGVTKAGLIYHFKTRDELLAALVERMVGEIELQSLGRGSGQGEKSLRSLLQSMAEFTFDMKPSQKRLLTNMLAAAASYPQFLPPAQALFERGYRELSRGPAAGQALLLSAALDGMLLLELLQLHHFTPTQRKAMHSALQGLLRDLP